MGDQDHDMQAADWEEGGDMDEEFRNGDCVELEFDEDEPPPDSDDDGLGMRPIGDEEIGVLNESDIYSDEEAQPIVDEAMTSVMHKESVLSVAISPADKQLLVTGGQDDVAVMWTMEDGAGGFRCTARHRLEGHTDSVVQVAFSHDGTYLATGSYDGTVKIWTAADGKLAQSLEGPSKEVEWILWHPKGHAILAGSTDAMAWMWWAPSGKLMQIFAGHAQSVTCGCWGLGGKLICTGSEDRGVIVWNPRSGTPQQHLRQVHGSAIIAMTAHPESPMLVTGSEDSGSKVIQMETGKVIAELGGHGDSVESVGFNQPAAGGFSLLATASMDGKVLVWDGKTFDMRCSLTDHFEQGGVVRFRWLNASRPHWLCTCSTDRTLRLFNALSGACLRTFRGHTDTVLDFDSVLIPPEASNEQQLLLVSGSEDNSCRVFALACGAVAAAADGSPASATSPAGAQLPPTPSGAEGISSDRSPGSLPV